MLMLPYLPLSSLGTGRRSGWAGGDPQRLRTSDDVVVGGGGGSAVIFDGGRRRPLKPDRAVVMWMSIRVGDR